MKQSITSAPASKTSAKSGSPSTAWRCPPQNYCKKCNDFPLFAYASPFAFGTIFSTRKLSSIKIHPCRSCYNTATSAYYIYHFSLQILQSSYLAQWAQTNLMIFLISPHGLKRLIASDFSAKNTFHTEDYRHHYWTTTHEPGSGNRVVCDHTRNLKDTKVLPKSYRCLMVVA